MIRNFIRESAFNLLYKAIGAFLRPKSLVYTLNSSVLIDR